MIQNDNKQQRKNMHHHKITQMTCTTTVTNSTNNTSTTTKSLFKKLSSNSSGNVSANFFNSNFNPNSNELLQTPNLPTLNPFEENNKFRLEESVLSPNLFHVASTSTPERDSSCLWNIHQRAILYPADIPTDESSLIAQCINDNRMSKQVSAAVEAFWNQNKIIIESPLASNSTINNQLKNRFGIPTNSNSKSGSSTHKNNFHKKKNSKSVNSPLSYDFKYQFSSNANRNNLTNSTSNNINSLNSDSCISITTDDLVKIDSKKDQICQTILSFPINLDVNTIPGLSDYQFENIEKENESPENKNKSHQQLNNSIRKKLFDYKSDDLSTTTTQPIYNIGDSIISPEPKHLATLNKSSTEMKNKNLDKIKTLPITDSKSDWDNDEFDDYKASSPNNNYNKILFDFGDEQNDNDDSVFEPDYHPKMSPNLSPLLATPKVKNKESNPVCNSNKIEMSIFSNSLFSKNLQHQHHQRYVHFDLDDSNDKKQNDILSSPNLSPIKSKDKDKLLKRTSN